MAGTGGSTRGRNMAGAGGRQKTGAAGKRRRAVKRAAAGALPATRATVASIALATTALVGGLAAPASSAAAESTVRELPDVVVSASRRGQQTFDAPAAIQSVDRETIGEAGPQVNLSEALNRIPGITALNRQNYAQDLQISIRGFGSRSTFGIRGVRLLVDGIPATMPDGQGQASSLDLGSTERIEVLRGPLAQLYGNAAGGVIQAFTASGEAPPSAAIGVTAGSYGLRRYSATANGRWEQDGGRAASLLVNYNDLRSEGYRDHSEARRRLFNAKLDLSTSADTSVTVVANVLDQPLSRDPLGLTRAQVQANPRQAVPIAYAQDTGKTISQHQVGLIAEHRFDPRRSITARVYTGSRDLDQWLAVPLAAQNAATSAGGIVDLDRSFGGIGLQYTHQVPTDAGLVSVVLGIDHDTLSERRRGFLNDGGLRSGLKRDEDDKVRNTDFYGQLSWDITEAWTLIAGARSSRVRFSTRDYYVVAGNPDDSGRASYSAVNPVLGAVWRLTDDVNLYAHLGRGFETPTFSELAYRPGGESGLNFALNSSRSRQAEIGAKFRLSPRQRFDVALFDIRTDDEIAVDSNVGGRSIFRNVGATQRRGLESSYRQQVTSAWSTLVALTWLDAEFRDSFGGGAGAVAAGNKLPGVPNRQLYAELAWVPDRVQGPFAGLELVHAGRIYVNDVNTDSASSATLGNLRAGWRFPLGDWQLTTLARIDNLTDKQYVGSVIVNDGNQRFFEPAPERNWLVGIQLGYRFR